MASPPNGGSGTHRPLSRQRSGPSVWTSGTMGHFLRMGAVVRQASSLPAPLRDAELRRRLADLVMKARSLAEAAHL
jgi:hypothetical protein